MKTIQVVSKATADKILTESLFKPVNGRTLSVGKYDGGKYAPGAYVGRNVKVGDHVHAIYMVRRKDRDGPYMQAMCVYS